MLKVADFLVASKRGILLHASMWARKFIKIYRIHAL